MGGLGPLDWPKTLGKMEAGLDAVRDGLRRHESTYAALLRPDADDARDTASLLLKATAAAEEKAVEASRAEVAAADAMLAREEDAVRHWLDAYQQWPERAGGPS